MCQISSIAAGKRVSSLFYPFGPYSIHIVRILLGHPKDVYQTCAPKALTSLQGSDTVASLNGVVKALRCLER